MPEIAVLGKRKQYDKGTSFLSIAEECQPQVINPIALLTFNGKMMELSKKVEKDGVIRFITTAEEAGRNTYRRTAEMILIKAVKNITGDAERTYAAYAQVWGASPPSSRTAASGVRGT